MMKNMKVPLKTKIKKIDLHFNFKPLSVESGIFSETSHYSNVGALTLYTFLLYGTSNIPARNILGDINNYALDNIPDFVRIYLKNDNEDAGHIIGNKINSFHKLTMKNYNTIPNAMSTIVRKGFNDPFIHSGALLRSLSYKVNGSGLFGGG